MIKKILTLVFLVSIVLAQRGGGGGGGVRGGGRGRNLARRKRAFALPLSGCSEEKCPALGAACRAKCFKKFKKGQKQQNLCLQECNDDYGQQPINWLILPPVLGLYFAVMYGCKHFKLPTWNLDRSFIKDHQKRTEQYECSLSDIEHRFNDLTSKYMSMSFIQDGQSFTSSDCKIYGKKHKTIKYLYDIRIESYDNYGEWEGTGLMSFSGDGVRIWFTKVYKNRKAAGQTGLWCTIIYEGEYHGPTRIIGVWYFQGFSKSERYSGAWRARFVEYSD